MALTPSTMLDLGTFAPDFTLPDAHGKIYTLSDQKIDKGLLVIFMCNHCPYVIHIKNSLVQSIRNYQEQGITVVAVNSNDFISYPDDSPDKMIESARESGFTFPYLIDEQQEAARNYRAACTPDFFLFNSERLLIYRGQYDNARPGNEEPITGKDLTAAVVKLLDDSPISPDQKPSMGCNIKWKPGNEPDYFG